jgi:hypothetical protein
MSDESPESQWISIPRAAAILGIGQRAVRTLVRRELLTSRSVVGSYPRVLRRDVERVARESTTPARAGT